MALFGNSIQARVAGKGLKFLWYKARPFAVAAVVVVGAVNIAYYIKRQQRRKKWNSVGQDVVVLHMFPRGRFSPNLSPFVLKLETYLRMAEIPYEVDFEEPLGPKGKSPWISLNGEEVGDSQLIVEMLGSKYGKDFSSHLTADQLAVSRAMRIMMEDHFLWCLAVWRFDIDAGQTFLDSIDAPYIFRYLMTIIKRRIISLSKVQGMGRHSHKEVVGLGQKDLLAVSVCLGECKNNNSRPNFCIRCNIMWRWVYDPECHVSSLTHWGTWLPFHFFYRPLVGRLLKFQAYMHGIGRHTQLQVLSMGHGDLQAMSVFLGEKPFLMGEKPTEVDCAIFGFLAQVVWNAAGSPYQILLEGECSNLQAYCYRVKDMFWPDWGQCLNPPQSEASL